MRWIGHFDINYFYCQVELFYNPHLVNFPVAVVGDIENRHGIVLAKNPIAKSFGVATGDTLSDARWKAKGLVTLPADFRKYLKYSRIFREVMLEFSPLIMPYGLDEVFVDLTGSVHFYGSIEALIEAIRSRVKEALALTISSGVSFCPVFAKLGSDLASEDSVVYVTKDNYKEVVWPLPVKELLFVGRSRSMALRNIGISTIGQLAQADREIVRKRIHKPGLMLHDFANGHDLSPVTPSGFENPIKSIGNSITCYRDLIDEQDARLVFDMLSDSVGTRLREAGLRGKGIAITMRDNKLYSFTRQMQFRRPSFTSHDFTSGAMELMHRHYDWHLPLRSVEVRAINLVDAVSNIQLTLFDQDEKQIKKLERIEHTKDKIRLRFGHHAIMNASALFDKRLSMVNPKENHTIFPPGQYF